ncbi:MAG: hypothetical protein LBT83_08385 [Tannerella sp.]|jgi:hypothetical protein|nr:hypothetical protein [Tannerella sp.]
MNKYRVLLCLKRLMILSVSFLQGCSDFREPVDVKENILPSTSYEKDHEIVYPYLTLSEKGYVLKCLLVDPVKALDINPVHIDYFAEEVPVTKAQPSSEKVILAELYVKPNEEAVIAFESTTATIYSDVNVVGKDFILMGFSGTTLSYIVFLSESNIFSSAVTEWTHRGIRNKKGKYQWVFSCDNGTSGNISFFEHPEETAPSSDNDPSTKTKRVLNTLPHTPWPAEPLK